MKASTLIGCYYTNDFPNLNDGDQSYGMLDPTNIEACLARCAQMGFRYASFNFMQSTIYKCMCDNYYNRGYLITI